MSNVKNYFNELLEYMEGKTIINTHSHHMEDKSFTDFNLDVLLKNSYVDWCGVSFDKTKVSRQNYLNQVRYNSYFVWLQNALQKIYKIKQPLTADNWNYFSEKIRDAHKDKNNHIRLLKQNCHYEKIILDAYWNPGDDNGYPKLFATAYRVNIFYFGYNRTAKDLQGLNPQELYGEKIDDLASYVEFMRKIINQKVKEGSVALKSAVAYFRGLDFNETTRDKAERVFLQDSNKVTEEDIKAFQDYISHELFKIAAELDIPFQIHTGLGLLKKSNAMQLQEIIEKNPSTKFVLFHCGYPWMDDVAGLFHVYPNVYPDICWLPLISTSACERFLHELIEVGTASKICWGGDTWTGEESYGALLAVRYVLAKVLSQKIKDAYLSVGDARLIVDNILYNNPRQLYNLETNLK